MKEKPLKQLIYLGQQVIINRLTLSISQFSVTVTTEEVTNEEVLETIQENFEKAEEIVPEDQMWIPTEALDSIKEEIKEIEDIDEIIEPDEPDAPEEPEEPEEEDEPMDMELVILFSVFSVAEAFTIIGLVISICQSEWVVVSFFGVLLGILRKFFDNFFGGVKLLFSSCPPGDIILLAHRRDKARNCLWTYTSDHSVRYSNFHWSLAHRFKGHFTITSRKWSI